MFIYRYGLLKACVHQSYLIQSDMLCSDIKTEQNGEKTADGYIALQ